MDHNNPANKESSSSFAAEVLAADAVLISTGA
jgi:hypothetical protein